MSNYTLKVLQERVPWKVGRAGFTTEMIKKSVVRKLQQLLRRIDEQIVVHAAMDRISMDIRTWNIYSIISFSTKSTVSFAKYFRSTIEVLQNTFSVN